MQFAHYLEARLLGTLHGQETVSVMHFGTDEAAADNEAVILLLTNLAAAIIACAIAQLLGAVTQDWTLTGVDCRRLSPNPTDPVLSAAPAGSVGLRQPVNASFECIVMRKKTGVAGKSKRGRNFLPPPGDADVTNSLIIAGDSANFYAGFIDCLADKFIGAAKTEPYTLCVYSRKLRGPLPGDFAAAFEPATNLSIDQRLHSLRSRSLGHGG